MNHGMFTVEDGTDIPIDIFKAIEENRLVLFVGAGASTGDPSNLPSFNDLVRQICIDTGHTEFYKANGKRAHKYKKESLDSILGRIQDAMGDRGNSLHNEIYRILSATTVPNATHRSIVGLASVSETLRIVTTNQDLLLEHDDLHPSGKPNVFDAPALPNGDDFEGVVHLHGSISDVRRMIFTDHDFGRAYLTKQYCARFLTELFSSFTVLFVGYSHNDPLMKYHARGLGSCKRFILTDEPEHPNWSMLDISPIGFPKEEYGRIPGVLDAIANHARMGRLERIDLITRIALSEPEEMTEYETSTLYECFESAREGDIDLLAAFASKASSYKWCAYLEDHPEPAFHDSFSKIFQDADYDTATKYLADWFVRICLARDDDDASMFALKKLTDRNWVWNAFFWKLIFEVLRDEGNRGQSASVLGLLSADRLKGIQLRESKSSYTMGELIESFEPSNYIVQGLTIENNEALFLAILDKITEPFLISKPDYLSLPNSDSLGIAPDVRFPADDTSIDWAIGEWWGDGSKYSQYYPAILDVIVNNIERYYQYRRAASIGSSFDRNSYSIDSLISGKFPAYGNSNAIAVARTILVEGEELTRRLFWEKHQSSTDPLLVRLSMVAVESSTVLSQDDKIAWLIDNDLFLPEENHYDSDFEIYEMMESNIKGASEKTMARLIASIESKRGRFAALGHESTWDKYELLCRIKKLRQNWSEEVDPLIERYRQDDSWSEDPLPTSRQVQSVSVPQAPPAIEVADFIREFEQNPREAMGTLFSTETEYEKEWGRPEFYERNSKYVTINGAIQQDATLALGLWDQEPNKIDDMPDTKTLRLHILNMLDGISDYSLIVELMPRISALVESAPLDESDLFHILYYIQHAIKANCEVISDLVRQEIIILCDTIRERFATDFVLHGTSGDPVQNAAGCWPWSIIDVFLFLLDSTSNEKEDAFIPDGMKKLIRTALEGSSDFSKCTALRLYMNLGFVYYKDTEFGNELLLPFLDSPVEKQTTVWFAWVGFFRRYSFDDSMLSSGLLHSILMVQPSANLLFDIPEVLDSYHRLFFSLLSSASLSEEILYDLQIRSAKEESLSLSILEYAYKYAQSEPAERFEAIWDKWLGRYITNRLSNRPIKLSSSELNAVINVALSSAEKLGAISGAVIESSHLIAFDSAGTEKILPIDVAAGKIPPDQIEPLISLICYILANHTGIMDYWFLRGIAKITSQAEPSLQQQISESCTKAGIILPSI